MISGCHPGDCHYQKGNEQAWRRIQFLRGLLAHFRLADRVKMVYVSAGEGTRFQEIVTHFTDHIRKLGACPLRDEVLDVDTRQVDKRRVFVDLLNWVRRRIQPSLGAKAEVVCDEMAEGFGEPVYDAEKCIGCGACALNCPLENIELRDGERDRAVHYFHSRCVGCGTCEEVCPEEAISVRKHLDLVSFMNETSFEPLRLSLRRCERCGAGFVPEKQIETAAQKHPSLLQSLDLGLCPECRRAKAAAEAFRHRGPSFVKTSAQSPEGFSDR
jgi:ferredoxin